MTIATEFLSFDSPGTRIGIRMTDIARCTGVCMPGAMVSGHKAPFMRPGVRPFDSIRIHMTRDASRIGALRVVAGCTAFDIPSGQLSMHTTAGSDSNRHKPRLSVRLWLEFSLVDIPSCCVTRCTEGLLVMTRLAVGSFAFNRETVGKLEVQIVYLRRSHPLTAIVGSEPRRAE